MPAPGPRTTYRYSEVFKATAVRLSQLPGVSVGDVAESLYIHPFMLSRWRKLVREGVIMSEGVEVDKETLQKMVVCMPPRNRLLATTGPNKAFNESVKPGRIFA